MDFEKKNRASAETSGRQLFNVLGQNPWLSVGCGNMLPLWGMQEGAAGCHSSGTDPCSDPSTVPVVLWDRTDSRRTKSSQELCAFPEQKLVRNTIFVSKIRNYLYFLNRNWSIRVPQTWWWWWWGLQEDLVLLKPTGSQQTCTEKLEQWFPI